MAIILLSTFSFALLPTVQASYGRWSEPENAGPPINTASREYAARLSQDMLNMLFVSYNRPGGYGELDIWMSTRPSIDDPWGTPTNLGPTINTPYNDLFGCESSNRLTLYFDSDRPGGYGDEDIYMSTRPSIDDPWGTPTNRGPTINTDSCDCQPVFSIDELIMYFGSDRLGGYGELDIWMSTRPSIDDPWGTPTNLGSHVNSPYEDGNPSISPNGLTLYFDSERPGGYGGSDMWMSTRPSIYADWSESVNLGPTINTAYGEWTPWICSDRITLYFDSDTPGGYGSDDLWMSKCTTVGGVWVPVDKFGLLAPYIGLASTVLVATVATAIYIKRVKRRKEKQ